MTAHPATCQLAAPLRGYVERVLEDAGAAEPPLAVARARHVEEVAELWGRPPDELAAIEELTAVVGGRELTLRLYRPIAERTLPGLLWLHGGGWAVGDLATHDALCRAIATRGHCCVIAVAYRLAPEHPFPAAIDDGWAALRWVRDHCLELGIDPLALAVGGDSAGGNLAAVIARRARDSDLPLALQILVYPVTDADFMSSTYRLYAEGLNLTRARMQWYWSTYAAGTDVRDPDLSPLRAAELAGLPTALIQTAELDVLRAEAESYAAALRAAGVDVTLSRYVGTIHGFLQMPALTPTAGQALEEIASRLRMLDTAPAA